MSDTFKANLNVGSARDPFIQGEDAVPMADLIPQILIERQLFLNLTEEALEAEIANRDDEPQSLEPPVEEELLHVAFQKQKAELLSHINLALNETSLSLDFVSLLMSAVQPELVKSTISPLLSKTVPLGSLNSDRLAETPAVKNTESIGMGWKYQSLRNITQLFKESSTQLRQQVRIEQTYWEMVHNVLQHGEVLFKVRDPLTGARGIGVKYGYGDSGLSYSDKGLAVLRRDDENGQVTFTPIAGRNKVKTFKFTRVRILGKIDDDYMLTGQSAFDRACIEDKSEHRVINDIEKARYFLFEEDLFYHLIGEAKNLVEHGVTIAANRIIVDVLEQIIEIELVPYNPDNEDEWANTYQNINKELSVNNGKAEAVLSFLKLMLCCYYRYNLDLRNKMPTSFTKWKQANSHPLLLRPLIGHIRHEISVANMSSIISGVCNELPDTLTHTLSTEKYKNLQTGTGSFRKATERPESTFSIVLHKVATDEYLSVKVEVTSSDIFVNVVLNLTSARYKSQALLELNSQATNVLQLRFTDMLELEESLNWVIMNFND